MSQQAFWLALDTLVASSKIVVDRPRGSAHPRHPDIVYPLDYGYLDGTTSGDGGGIDVWLGSLAEKQVSAVVVNVDLHKRDTEIKILLGCTPEECQMVLNVHDQSSWGGLQSGILIERKAWCITT